MEGDNSKEFTLLPLPPLFFSFLTKKNRHHEKGN
jgi:hypothetical protein